MLNDAKGFTSRIVVGLMILIFLSCQRPAETAAASPVPIANNAAPSGTRTEEVLDPTLDNMKAFSVTLPAKWHFRGVTMQPTGCTNGPAMVWRASSPDGLSYAEQMPTMGWTWGSYKSVSGCMPLTGPISAQDFLKHMAVVMNVEYVADEPVPPEANEMYQKVQRDTDAKFAGDYAARRQRPPKNTVELAQAIVRYRNGSFAMKGGLGVILKCVERYWPQLMDGTHPITDTCTADVNYFTTPENQFDAIKQQWRAPGMGARMNIAWLTASSQRSTQAFNQYIDAVNKESNDQFRRQSQAQLQNFNQQQAARQQMHNEFMATMQRGTNMSMQRTHAGMNARSAATSDWVDYSLDRQTVVDPNTGNFSKVSSSNSYTWVDSSGKAAYQTNDPNGNPNGVIPGNWTKQQVVHGNGAQ